jgi:hypothetical protein
MDISLTIDTRPFARAAEALLAVLPGKTGAELVREQGRLLVLDLVRLTPPTGRHAFTESFAVQKGVQMKKIAQSLRAGFQPVADLNLVRSPNKPALGAALQKYIDSGNVAALQRVLTRLGFLRRRVITEATPGLAALRSFYSPRKRRFYWREKFLVMRAASIEQTIAAVQSRIGKAKAGWNAAARILALGLPGWISRHPTPGWLKDETHNALAPELTLANLVDYADNWAEEMRIVQKALDRRASQMQRRMEIILKAEFAKHNPLLPGF